MPAWQNRPDGPKAHPLVLHRPVQKNFTSVSRGTLACRTRSYKPPNAIRYWEASMRRKFTEQSLRPEVTSGEIIVGLAWVVFYVVLVASGWARDAIVLLAERAPSELF